MESFGKIIKQYERSHFNNEEENSSPNSRFNEVLQKYKEHELKKGISEKIKKKNERKIRSNEIIDELKIFIGGKHFYIFEGKKSFRIILKFSKKIDGYPKIRFKDKRYKKSGDVFYIIPNKKSTKKYIFYTDKIGLENPTNNYRFDIEVSGKIVLEDLELKSANKNLECPENAIFVDRENEYSSFPEGDFLKLKPTNSTIKKQGVIVFYHRCILKNIKKAYLYQEGDFKEKITGDRVWCLIPENYDR
ncbi:MAG: hypothetical protein ABEK36_05710 [Candidatus Aenigmatarchaeota archaeon]